MKTSQQINMAIAFCNTTKTKVAKSIGMTRQNFSMKLKRESFSREELDAIANVLGGKFVAYFEFKDGTKI